MLELSRYKETTALGAAYLAGLATGFWESLEEVGSLWTKEKTYDRKWSRTNVTHFMKAGRKQSRRRASLNFDQKGCCACCSRKYQVKNAEQIKINATIHSTCLSLLKVLWAAHRGLCKNPRTVRSVN